MAAFHAVRNLLRPTLTCLHLTHSGAPPTVEGWFNLLRSMPLLEDLNLNMAVTLPDAPISGLPLSERVRLDHKRRIALRGWPGGLLCAEFVRNLILPPNIHISLGTYFTRESQDYIREKPLV